MWVVGHFARGLEDVLDPRSRMIGFGDGPPQVAVIDSMRYGWVRPAGPSDDAEQYFKAVYETKVAVDEEREKMPETLNLDIASPWKLDIYHQYNHLFWDVSDFLSEVNCAMGHFHPPKESHFPITTRSVQKTFDTNVLIMPAYLMTDCTVDVSTSDETGLKVTLGSFNMAERHTVLFLKKDMPVDFDIVYPDGHHHDSTLAAVMVVGHLCTDDHDRENDCVGHGAAQRIAEDSENHGGHGDADIATEVQSSIANVLLMYQMDQQRKMAEGKVSTEE